MVEGELHSTEEGQDVNLTAGEWYLQRPNLLQSSLRTATKPNYYHYVHFTPPPFSLSDLPLEPRRYAENEVTIPIRGQCDWRQYEYILYKLDNYPISNLTDAFHVQELFCAFYRTFLETAAITSSQALSAPVREMKEFIREWYQSPHILELLSERFHYSRDYLRKLFLSEMNHSPTAYQSFIRVEHSKWLLEATNYSIECISSRVGWDDVSTFSRNFKRFCGCSPSDWRRQEKSWPPT